MWISNVSKNMNNQFFFAASESQTPISPSATPTHMFFLCGITAGRANNLLFQMYCYFFKNYMYFKNIFDFVSYIASWNYQKVQSPVNN